MEGEANVKFHAVLQAGLLVPRYPTYDIRINSLAWWDAGGFARHRGASSNDFALCAVPGLSSHRFSFDARVFTSTPSYAFTVRFEGGGMEV